MPEWSPSADGVIAIRAPLPSAPTTPRTDQDATLMATLNRLGRGPTATAGRVDAWPTDAGTASASPIDTRTTPPQAAHQGGNALVWADLPRLADQLHTETQAIRRLLRRGPT